MASSYLSSQFESNFLLKSSSVRPKKHLGQHFLKDQNIAEKIVNALSEQALGGKVLEVGPGTGVLTQYLIAKEIDFLAFDVDEESVAFLKAQYPSHDQKFLLKDFLREPVEEKGVSVIGNFPYNISSQLFFKIYDDRSSVSEVVCMIQKEVAQRLVASHGNKVYGILSVLMQAFFDLEYLFTVPPGVFNPPPKVDSAVISLRRNSVDRLECDEKLFKRVVKEGFGKRRKTLRNALKNLNLPSSLTSDSVFDKRAEQLSVKDFISLTKRIEPLWKP